MLRALVIAAIASALAGVVQGVVYDTHEKTALSPAIAVEDGDVYLAWARLDPMMKFARFELSTSRGGEAYAQASQALTSRTNDPFAMVVGDGAIFLGFVDYRTAKVQLLRYAPKGKTKFKRSYTRSTQIKPKGGVSLAFDDGRLFLGYTDADDEFVRIVSYKVSRSGKISRENERKLAECETVVGSSIALHDGHLLVAWINSDEKYMLTTYAVDKSSKGPSYRHLKNTRTEIRVNTNPMDKPGLAAAGDEVYLAYVDRNDKTAHVKFYTLEADGLLRSAGETRVNERPAQPVCIAASTDKVYVALTDANKDLMIAEQ
ncbi:MAG: hypothetical protein V3W11_11795 [bacterium]